MKAAVAPRPVHGDDLRWRRQRLGLLLRGDDAVFLHAAEHIAEPFPRPFGPAVRIEEVRSLEETRQHRTLAKAEGLGRFAEIAPRRHLDAPGAAAEVSGIEIELENLRLGQRALDP